MLLVSSVSAGWRLDSFWAFGEYDGKVRESVYGDEQRN
jgi:hypothetical protein